MIAAVGCIKPDPKKTKAISVWPRPTRPEDVERFLATTVFIREHLSPQYSNISKPLRECLKDLQQKRRDKNQKYNKNTSSAGESKPGANSKGKGKGKSQSVDSKTAVPESSDQGCPDTSQDAHTYYSALRVPTWATKAEIVEAYRKIKQSRKVHFADSCDSIDTAYNTLADVEARKRYDETIGLLSKRKSRIELRPLGFYSKSLSLAQQSWPTWERELFAVLSTLLHFRTCLLYTSPSPRD